MIEQHASFAEFNSEHVSSFLVARPEPTRDFTLGDGSALYIAGGKAVLEVFPQGVVRMTNARARVEVHDVSSYTVIPERGHVVFEHGTDDERARLLVRDNGKFSFYPVLRTAESSRTNETTVSGRQDSPTLLDPSSNITGRNDTTSSSPEGEKGGEVQQVQLQGRLGRDPWFSTTEDQPVAGFPLAVNNERGQTTWHKVVVFDATATDLHEAVSKKQIGKGKLVDVTGQTVLLEEPKPNGGVKKSAEFHATAVTRVQSKPRPGR
jgi:hypothetical protein